MGPGQTRDPGTVSPFDDAELYRAELGGPQMYHWSFDLYAAGTKNTEYPRTGLRIGPRGKKRGRISHLILPKVCPESESTPG